MARLLNMSRAPFILAFGLGPLATGPAAAPQTPAPLQSRSIERIKDALEITPGHSLRYDVKAPEPVAIFRTSVNQRAFTLTILEQLRKDFELTALQRQSADWSAKCCGVNLLALASSIHTAWQHRQARNAREQVRRELADLRSSAPDQITR